MSSDGLLTQRGPDGIPEKSDYDGFAPEPKNLFVIYTSFMLVFASLGVALGLALLFFVHERKQSERFQFICRFDLGPLYVGLFICKVCFQLINANLGTARRRTKVNVPDQHVYQVFGGPADKSLVMMVEEGDLGKFNRAQRGLANLGEYLPLFVAEMLLAGFVFPWEVMVITILFSCARLLGAIKYTADRKARMTGNMLGMVMMGLLDGLLLVVGVKAICTPKAA